MSPPAYNNLAMLRHARGRRVEAEPLYVRSLEIREQTLAPDDTAIATSLNNLAELYRAKREYAKAEPLYSRSLAIRESPRPGTPVGRHDPEQHRGAVSAPGRVRPGVSALQAIDRDQGENRSADPTSVAISLNNLALQYHSQKRYAEAEKLFVRARTTWERAPDSSTPTSP